VAIFPFDAPKLGPCAFAPRRRLLDWLKGRLAARGVEAVGPLPNGADWRLAVNAEAGGVTIRLGRPAGGRCALIVEKYGDADLEYEDALAACADALALASSAPAAPVAEDRIEAAARPR
jgi:hypothetical protein